MSCVLLAWVTAPGRHRAAEEGGVDRAVAQHVDRTALGAVDLGEVVVGHAVRRQQGLDEHLEAGAGDADHRPLTRQVTHGGEARVGLGDERRDVRRQRGDRADLVALLPTRFPQDREVADRRVRHGEFQFAAREPADVLLRALRPARLDPPVVLSAVVVQHFGDRAADDREGAADRRRPHAEKPRVAGAAVRSVSAGAGKRQDECRQDEYRRENEQAVLHRRDLVDGRLAHRTAAAGDHNSPPRAPLYGSTMQ